MAFVASSSAVAVRSTTRAGLTPLNKPINVVWSPVPNRARSLSRLMMMTPKSFGRYPTLTSYGTLFEPLLSEMMNHVVDTDTGFIPSGELIDDENEFTLRLEVPGVKKEDISTELKGDFIIISGEKKDEYMPSSEHIEGESKSARRHKFGWSYFGKFSKQIRVPKNADRSAISANLKDGVLVVTLPKIKSAEEVSIPIDVQEKTH